VEPSDALGDTNAFVAFKNGKTFGRSCVHVYEPARAGIFPLGKRIVMGPAGQWRALTFAPDGSLWCVGTTGAGVVYRILSPK